MSHEARQNSDERKRQLETDAETEYIPTVDSPAPLHRLLHADETPATHTHTPVVRPVSRRLNDFPAGL